MVRNDIILGYDGRGKFGIMKKAAVIVNPVAGKMKIKSGILDLLASLGRQDYETAVYVTKARGDASDAAERYGRECDLVVCCGGDGTLNEVISGLLRISEKPLLLYYPCGSTNDFATTLGLPKKIDAAALDIANRKVMELDVGSLNGSRHFSYITSFGIFTKASFSADQKKGPWVLLFLALFGVLCAGIFLRQPVAVLPLPAAAGVVAGLFAVYKLMDIRLD